MSKSSPKQTKKKSSAKKRSTAARSKPSATTAQSKTHKAKKKPTSKSKFKVNPKKSEILKLLRRYYKDAVCALDHETPYQLLVATTLSAQCTDARVNLVTPSLFERYPNAHSMAKANIRELESLIHSTGFYKNKAKNILSCAKELVAKYDGEVPKTMEELNALAGVGRKTANVVLGNAFGIPGMVVDTHVTRLSNRLKLAEGRNAVVLERDLEKVVPKEHWVSFSHWLISHGRAICKARSPRCSKCFLETICPQIGVD